MPVKMRLVSHCFAFSFCTVGTRIVGKVQECSKDYGTELYFQFCKLKEVGNAEDNDAAATTPAPAVINYTLLAMEKSPSDFVCDQYFEENNASWHQGIRGLSSNAFFENLPGKFRDKGDALSNSSVEAEWNLGGNKPFGYITADIYTSFVMLVGIFFPSCTGK